MLSAVLLDVGGTLWPDRWPNHISDEDDRVAALRRSEPDLPETEARTIVHRLSAWKHPPCSQQQTASVVQLTLGGLASTVPVNPSNVISAMCLPALGRVELFHGARDLLRELAERRVRVVLATNVVWRSTSDQYRDLADLGLDRCVSACVTSLDVGWRKPHPRFFSSLLRAAACPAAECVMVGDSEVHDIIPARDLGMATVKVVHGGDQSETSSADRVCGSLPEVARVLLDHMTGPQSVT